MNRERPADLAGIDEIMKGKIFSAEEVTRMLPLVRRIVMNLRACSTLLSRHERQIAELELEAECSGQDPSEDALAEHREKIAVLREKSAACEQELNDLGGHLEDASRGIAKFYGERDSRIVYLTWRLGESTVSWWHPIEKTYRDRLPLDDERVARA
ncbi:MAG: DUF2203 family protein [Planctomycetota bacterium]